MSETPLEVQEDIPAEFPTESWTVKNLKALDWALSQLADLRREQEENLLIETEVINRAKLRTEKLNAPLSKSAEFLMGRVTAYAEEHRAELLGGGKKKTRALLHGVISWRSSSEKLRVMEPEKVLEWAQTQPVELGLIRIKEELEKKALDAHHKKTGELPPGTELEPAREELKIEPVLGGNLQ